MPNSIASAKTDPQTTIEFTVTGAYASNQRYGKFARYGLSVAIATHALFALLFTLLGVTLMVWVNLVSIAIYGSCVALARRNYNRWISWAVLIELLGHAIIATRAVGYASGFEFYAWLIIPLAAISTRSGLRKKAIMVGLGSIACLIMDQWLQRMPPLTVLPASTLALLHTFNLAAYFTIMATLAFSYAQTVAEAERGLHKHATTDVLTGLRNRRRLLELARGELARARRSGAPVSIIMTDIDLFKSINDRYGHPTGDQVIAGIAQCIQQCVRQQDHAARWGGEEFIIVLPDIDLHGAQAAAERMRQRIEQLRIAADVEALRCTASFGVSEWKHGRGETFEQCLDKADAALYCAKQMGRNRVCVDQTNVLQDHAVADVLSSSVATPRSLTTPAASHATQVMPAHRNAS
jgi:diguanylate cyclase (GGDEF)-like protein